MPNLKPNSTDSFYKDAVYKNYGYSQRVIVLMNEAVHCMTTLEPPETRESFYEDGKCGGAKPTTGRGDISTLDELDVVEMFPRMCREQVLQAMEKVHEMVAQARRVRGKG